MVRKPSAKGRKLKVFRTAIGFHDAYVAAPSRNAALAAWGSDADLFARGVAEEVTGPELMAAALARPGEVVRRSRGTTDEYFAALPRTQPRKAAPAAGPTPTAPEPDKAKPRPPPSRTKLDAAEAAIDAADARFRREAAALKEQNGSGKGAPRLGNAPRRRDRLPRTEARCGKAYDQAPAAR